MSEGGCLQRPEASDAPGAGHQDIVSLWCGYWGMNSGVLQEPSVLYFTYLLPSPNCGILNYITSLKCIFLADQGNVIYSVEESLLHAITKLYHITQISACVLWIQGEGWSLKSSFISENVIWVTHARWSFSESFLNQEKKIEVWYFSVHTRPAISALSPIQ